MKEKVKLCVAFAAHTLKSSHLCQGGGWTLGAGVEDVPYNYMRGGPVFTAVTSDFIRGAERVLGARVNRKYRSL